MCIASLCYFHPPRCFHCGLVLFVQCGIDIRALLTEKKKRDKELKKQQEKERKAAKKEAKKQVGRPECCPRLEAWCLTDRLFLQSSVLGHIPTGPFSLKDLKDDDYERLRRQSEGNVSQFSLTDVSANGQGQENWAYQHEPSAADDKPAAAVPPPPVEEEETGQTRSIILDLSTVCFVDTTAVNTLRNVRVPSSVVLTCLHLRAAVRRFLFLADFHRIRSSQLHHLPGRRPR